MDRLSFVPFFRLMYVVAIVFLAGYLVKDKMDEPEIRIISKDVGLRLEVETDTVTAFSLLRDPKTDFVWWTTSDPSRVTVYPLSLETGKLPGPGSAQILSRAKITRISSGPIMICAQLFRTFSIRQHEMDHLHWRSLSRDCAFVQYDG